MIREGSTPWRARVQVFDAPFSLNGTQAFTLHHNSTAFTIPAQQAQPVFDDTDTYWYATLPNHGVKLPALGVQIRVLKQDANEVKIRIIS